MVENFHVCMHITRLLNPPPQCPNSGELLMGLPHRMGLYLTVSEQSTLSPSTEPAPLWSASYSPLVETLGRVNRWIAVLELLICLRVQSTECLQQSVCAVRPKNEWEVYLPPDIPVHRMPCRQAYEERYDISVWMSLSYHVGPTYRHFPLVHQRTHWNNAH